MTRTMTAAIIGLGLLSAPALTSGLADPVVAPEVVAAEATASSGSLDSAIPALFAILVLLHLAGAL